MIPLYGCDACLTVVMIRGNLARYKELIVNHVRFKEGWPCVRCSSRMEQLDLSDAPALKIAAEQNLVTRFELTVEEFFQALCGFGLPQEIGCEPEVIRALLLSSKIIGLATQTSPSGRTIVDHIKLENGLVLHLAGSPNGATVFKITRALDDGSDQRAVQAHPQDRDVSRGDRVVPGSEREHSREDEHGTAVSRDASGGGSSATASGVEGTPGGESIDAARGDAYRSQG